MNSESKIYRIVIAGDLVPSGKNLKLFEEGNAKELFGGKIIGLFSNSDFSIFNLEGPLTDCDKPIEKTGPVIKAPLGCVQGIKELGVKAVALANNHITDYEEQGYKDTIRVLGDSGIEHLGAGKCINNIKKHISLSLGDKRFCIYNVSETFYNIPTNSATGVNLYDEYAVCNDIRELKQSHDFLIVIYHGGTEEFPYPTPLLRQRFRRMAESGADFITAQHTHCIGCYEEYKGSYLLYGQGNFLFARMKNHLTKQGLITEIVFSDKDVRINQHLVSVTKDDIVRYDETQDLSGFYKRSKDLSDYRRIEEKYKLFAYNRPIIKTRNLKSFRGDLLLYRIVNKISSRLYNKLFLEKYEREQLLRVAKLLESERYNEDMLAALRFMLEKNGNEGN